MLRSNWVKVTDAFVVLLIVFGVPSLLAELKRLDVHRIERCVAELEAAGELLPGEGVELLGAARGWRAWFRPLDELSTALEHHGPVRAVEIVREWNGGTMPAWRRSRGALEIRSLSSRLREQKRPRGS